MTIDVKRSILSVSKPNYRIYKIVEKGEQKWEIYWYTKNTEIGRKCIIPYALYRVDGYVSANLARKVTGFSEDDLQYLWKAIINMFEYDHSAAEREYGRPRTHRFQA